MVLKIWLCKVTLYPKHIELVGIIHILPAE